MRFLKTYCSIFAGTYEGLTNPRVAVAAFAFVLWACAFGWTAFVGPARALSDGDWGLAAIRFAVGLAITVFTLPICLWLSDWAADISRRR